MLKEVLFAMCAALLADAAIAAPAPPLDQVMLSAGQVVPSIAMVIDDRLPPDNRAPAATLSTMGLVDLKTALPAEERSPPPPRYGATDTVIAGGWLGAEARYDLLL